MNKQDNTSNGKGYITCSSLEELQQLTRFTPVKNKKPYFKQWQNNPKNISFCEDEIKLKKANGYGLITGKGLLAIDFDGANASKIALAIGKWLTEIDTLAWSSGKPSRKQILVSIPSHRLRDFEKLSRKELSSFGIVEAVENEQLEIRYNRCQSVLPPSAHPETKGYYWLRETKILQLNDYQCNCILSAIDTDIQSDKQYQELTDSQQLKLIESALEFIKSDNYHDWILVGMALKDSGYDFSLWDKWSRNSTKYKIGECDKKWTSFNGSGTSLGSLFWLAKQHGFDQKQWMRENLQKTYLGNRQSLEKKYNIPSHDLPPDNNFAFALNNLVSELSEPSVAKDERIAKATEFATLTRANVSSILSLIDARITENYKQDELDSLSTDLDWITANANKKLDLRYLIGDILGLGIEGIAKAIPTAPEAIFTAILPMIASRIGTQANTIVKASAGYTVPMILRTLIVGDSGQKKSPALAVAIKALVDKDREKGIQYKRALKQWQLEVKANPKDAPPEPLRVQYIVKNVNPEGLFRVHEENPIGLLNVVDEGGQYFKRMNKFNTGDDIEIDLETYNGSALQKNRGDKKYDVYLPKTAVNVTGTIQWHSLESLMSDNPDDSAGLFARWLFCGVDLPDPYFDPKENGEGDDYFLFMEALIDYVINLEITSDFILSPEAKAIFAKWQHELVDRQKLVHEHRIAIKYPKIEGEAVRFATVLHVLNSWYTAGGNTIEIAISAEAMKKGIYLANWFLGQHHYVLTKCGGNSLNGKLAKLLMIVRKKGECTANEAYLSNKRAFKNSKEVGSLMIDLENIGKVTRIPTTKGVRVKAN